MQWSTKGGERSVTSSLTSMALLKDSPSTHPSIPTRTPCAVVNPKTITRITLPRTPMLGPLLSRILSHHHQIQDHASPNLSSLPTDTSGTALSTLSRRLTLPSSGW